MCLKQTRKWVVVLGSWEKVSGGGSGGKKWVVMGTQWQKVSSGVVGRKWAVVVVVVESEVKRLCSLFFLFAQFESENAILRSELGLLENEYKRLQQEGMYVRLCASATISCSFLFFFAFLTLLLSFVSS